MRCIKCLPIIAWAAVTATVAQTAPSSASQSVTSQQAQKDAATPSQTVNTPATGASVSNPSAAYPSEAVMQGGTSKETYLLQNQTAQQQFAVGDYNSAITSFEQARNSARKSKDSAAEAEFSLHLARAIEVAAGKTTLNQENLQHVESAYKTAIQGGNASQVAAAHNGWAIMLLRQGDARAALEQLKAIDLKQVEPSRRAVYRYNLATANEKLGYWEQAYDYYLAAILDKPEYQAASEGAFRVLRNAPSPDFARAARLSETLLLTGQTASAESYTKQYLERWGRFHDAQRLLATLLQYYAIAPLALETLQTTEWNYLQKLATSAPGLDQPISNVRVTCFDNFAPVFDPFQARTLVPAWANEEWQRRAMAAMLKKTGDLFREAGKFRDALARYSAAWSLDNDSDAALYAASLLREQRRLIDSNEQLFDRLLQGIFEVKGMEYREQNWPNILRLHTILGTIFEQEKRWGPESDSHTAIFQWQHAISAEEQVRHVDPKFPRSPVLYMKLANAYRETGNPTASFGLYLSAAEAFVEASNSQQAVLAMKQAQSLGVTVPPAAQERMHKLDLAIHALSSTTAELSRRPDSNGVRKTR